MHTKTQAISSLVHRFAIVTKANEFLFCKPVWMLAVYNMRARDAMLHLVQAWAIIPSTIKHIYRTPVLVIRLLARRSTYATALVDKIKTVPDATRNGSVPQKTKQVKGGKWSVGISHFFTLTTLKVWLLMPGPLLLLQATQKQCDVIRRTVCRIVPCTGITRSKN